jgi:hypothetical protein
MFLPTHSIYLIKKDGTKENCAIIDCSTKAEVREFVKELKETWTSVNFEETYVKAQYVDGKDNVIYECTIKECMEEL